jgi:UDP-2-acetamido-2,6-beta-L-arabino-hexul-4-ose reductase
MRLVYVDDLVREMIGLIKAEDRSTGFCEVPQIYHVTLGRIVELIQAFWQDTQARRTPDLSEEFTQKLYDTYLSYLPEVTPF